MKKVAVLAAAVGVLSVQAALAGTITLTFDQLGVISPSQNGGFEPIRNYYDGGFAGNGTSNCGFTVCGPGPHDGVSFKNDAEVTTSIDDGGAGKFNLEPSSPNVLFFVSGAGDLMNVRGGFTSGISFFYAAVNQPGTLTLWSGLNGTGTLLATINLPITPKGGPACDQNFCPWVPFGFSFSGTAMSVNFSGTANQVGFDDLTLGSATPPPTIPEPATLTLFGVGLLVLAGIAYRRIQIAG